MAGKKFFTRAILLLTSLTFFSITPTLADSTVKTWEEPLVIPTYEVGKADPNPRFYTGRTYQGAQGRVYPYPMLDVLTDSRKDKTYKAAYLENKYVKICILPEIGGRVFTALDKTNDYDFLYRQHVIKPALIGMLGAWISGGIEWCIPHHHRATTFMPVDYTLQENADGSKTIWVGETELRHRMRWLVGITLYPEKSYMEATIKIINRTPFVNSILCWANVAVHANENYQVIFPPSTEYATYHGKNQFAQWPISHEFYSGVDYTRGVDLSWWKNHPSPISFFAWNYQDDFFAGYDHGKEAGTAYVSNHHIAPGKKLWEWGPGPRGQMWDKILTETDGPYIEIMAGAYSDNQPDYSWIQPYEVKIIKEYWYPLRKIETVKNANLKAAVNLEVTERNTAKVGFNTTSAYKNALVLLKAEDKVVFRQRINIGPDRPFLKEVALAADVREKYLRVSLQSSSGEELIAYKPVEKEGAPMPKPVEPPPAPEDIKTIEELYLTGLRLEQFHSAALEPYPYYEEALKRDPYDSRVNTELGILYCKRGMFKEAQEKLNQAIERLTKNYTSPKSGQAHYYLGLALKFQGKYDAAYDAFYKATWSSGLHTAGYYNLTEIDCIVPATDRMLRDGVGFESYVEKEVSKEFIFQANRGIISGTGGGMPLGVMNSASAKSIAKETAQPADTIVFQNILKMRSFILPASLKSNGLVWLYHTECFPQLAQMTMVVGTGGVPVWMPANGIAGKPFDTLFGYPAFPTEFLPVVGDAKDIMLVDLEEYLWISKGGIKADVSIHVYFTTNQTLLRFVWAVNGMPKHNSAKTLFVGSETVSPYLYIAERT